MPAQHYRQPPAARPLCCPHGNGPRSSTRRSNRVDVTEPRPVARGRAILLVLIGAAVVPQLFWAFPRGQYGLPEPEAALLTGYACLLWYAVWKGYNWAAILAEVLYTLRAIAGAIAGVVHVNALLIGWSLLSVVIVGCLLFSTSVRAFLRSQQAVCRGREGDVSGSTSTARTVEIVIKIALIGPFCILTLVFLLGLILFGYDLLWVSFFKALKN